MPKNLSGNHGEYLPRTGIFRIGKGFRIGSKNLSGNHGECLPRTGIFRIGEGFRLASIPLVLALVASWLTSPTQAQIPRPQDAFPDPSRMFEQVFGLDLDDQDEALAEIKVSVQEERRVGTQTVRDYLAYLKSQGIVVTDRGPEVAYLQNLVKTIHPRMRNSKRYPKIKVWLAKSPLADARSFPGGTLLFFEGIFECCGNEAALIGVVGHELSHLDREHQLRRVRQWKLAQQRLSNPAGPASPQQFMQTGMMFANIWTRPFRQEDELEADRDGARWAYQTGYDPRELAELFERLAAGAQPGFPMPSFLQSHPAPAIRRQTVLESLDQLQREQPADSLYIGQENLLRRIPRSQQEFAP